MNTTMIEDAQHSLFGLDELTAPPLARSPPGTWFSPQMSCAEYRQYLTAAARRGVPAPKFVHSIYQAGIAVALRELEGIQRRRKLADDTCCSLGELRVSAEHEVIKNFVLWCMDEASTSKIAEIHIHASCTTVVWACHFPDLGSVILRTWPVGVQTLYYSPGRSCALHRTYEDLASHRREPAGLWAEYCIDAQLKSTLMTPPRVRLLEHAGAWYVNVRNSAVPRYGYRQCEAWRVIAAQYWPHGTLTYAQLNKAWKDGSIDHGNCRGMLVTADQKPWVLDQCTIFFEEVPIPSDKDLETSAWCACLHQ